VGGRGQLGEPTSHRIAIHLQRQARSPHIHRPVANKGRRLKNCVMILADIQISHFKFPVRKVGVTLSSIAIGAKSQIGNEI